MINLSAIFVADLVLPSFNLNLEIAMTWNLIVTSTMNSILKIVVWGGLGLLGSQVISLTARRIETGLFPLSM